MASSKSDGVTRLPIRGRVEAGFEAWGHFAVRHRWAVILGSVLATALLVSTLPGLRIDNSVESNFRPNDPEVVVYNRFRDQFDRDDRIILALKPPQIFSLEFLEKLRALHRQLESEVPYVAEVTSLINARSTRGEGDTLVVGELMAEWPRG